MRDRAAAEAAARLAEDMRRFQEYIDSLLTGRSGGATRNHEEKGTGR